MRALFYLRNQMNVLNESVTTQEELQRYLSENKKDYIKSVAEKVYQTATKEKRVVKYRGCSIFRTSIK